MSVLVSERIKMRRTWLVPLSALGPMGIVGLTVILWILRSAGLHEKAAAVGAWQAVMGDMGMLEVGAITLGTAILVSLIFDLDHRAQGWKQLFALPVSRTLVYLSKLAWVAALLFGSSALAVLGVIGLWMWQDLGALPWNDLGLLLVVVWASVMPIVAIQGALSAHLRNQAFGITIGVAGSVLGLFVGVTPLPKWLPWLVPGQAMRWIVYGEGDPWRIIGMAAGTTLVVAVLGAWAYARRDVV